MDEQELFQDIHSMPDNALKTYYKLLVDMNDNVYGSGGIFTWIQVFMDGIQAEIADRFCGTSFNSVSEKADQPDNVIKITMK